LRDPIFHFFSEPQLQLWVFARHFIPLICSTTYAPPWC
jgi:hypothetical protein